jgi:2-C-methyl-D-erythritol 4-phosphate cytidylyltransferase
MELKKHCQSSDVVMVHDGNRPLVTNEIISDSLATFKKYGSAVAAKPCNEAIFKSKDDALQIFISQERNYSELKLPIRIHLRSCYGHMNRLKGWV